MAQITRQTNLLVQQDWTKIYQTFTNADFTSYDFETLRSSMINYLKVYYPESFNDFLESSEYLALIDMVAFLGQSLAFRTDLNARENFIDTAQRRDSIMKLARMLSYNPKRANSSSGLLKIESVSTTESIIDSSGQNLSNATVLWNDTTNDNWLEQFTTVLNAALITNQVIGKPGNTQTINGIETQEYSIGINTNTLPVAQFGTTVRGNTVNFEAVSATTVGKTYVYEVDPTTVGKFNILYRNDNNGNGSINTGFFLHFKQGTLNATTFDIKNSIPNNYVSIPGTNVNNTDSWLYSLNTDQSPNRLWNQVPALNGVNVIYNNQSEKNLYQINTLNNDQVNLVFGDGSFSNIPQGLFKFFYRVCNGATYSITPDDMALVTVAFPYISAKNSIETITFTASLKYTVTNASSAQSLASIKALAPQQYYTQNRMITGEDYNIFPLTTFTGIQKAKAVNRTSSGVSLYLDAIDPTGSYSTTNIFGDDGVISSTTVTQSNTFDFLTSNDIYTTIYNDVIPLVNSVEMRNYYYENFPRIDAVDSRQWTANTVFASNTVVQYSGQNYQVTANVFANTWASVSNAAVTSVSGLTFNQYANSTAISSGTLTLANTVQSVGGSATGNLQYVNSGALLRFIAPQNYHFAADHSLQPGNVTLPTDSLHIYAAVSSVVAGIDLHTPNLVKLATVVPTGAILDKRGIIPAYKNDFNNALVSTLVTQVQAHVNFGLRFNRLSQAWENILPADIGNINDWLLKFEYQNGLYKVSYRTLTYSFSSAGHTKFYYDPLSKVYSSATGTNVNDTIKILKVNTRPNSALMLERDYIWQIYDSVVESDGYVNNSVVNVKIPETQMENVPSNPDLFHTVANTATARDSLYFQYSHNAPSRSRIDPTPINIIDLYILTADYSQNYINWLRDLSGVVTEPELPTSTSLELAYNNLNEYKAMSDSIVYNPAKFKPLFGAKAAPSLQARFQVVKNPTVNVTDNEIKSQVVAAINTYFDISNWDFGDTFYFSELAAYLHSTLAPNISSVLIVPADTTMVFGNYFQINAEPWEIITSAATVDTIDIISAVTAASLNLSNSLIGGA
jgi:hypothetical protein